MTEEVRNELEQPADPTQAENTAAEKSAADIPADEAQKTGTVVDVEADPEQNEQGEPVIAPLKEGQKLTRKERDAWEAKASEIIDKIRPYIQHDGGDVELLGIDEDGIAYVTFLGACAGCMMAGEDFSTGIRLLLLDEFPELREVVLVG